MSPDPSFIAALTRVRVSSGAILRDSEGRIMIVRPTYKSDWEIPGGCIEPNESPAAACRRELREELGLGDRPLGRLLCVDWVPPAPPWDGALSFLFDGGFLDPDEIARVCLPVAELSAFEFIAPADVDGRLIPRLARRVRAGLRAVDDRAAPVYLEGGCAVVARVV